MSEKSNWDKYWNFADNYPRIDKIRCSVVHYVYQKLMRGVKFNTNPRILELGSGTGLATLQLLKQHGGVGCLVDKSQNAMAVSRNIYADLGVKNSVYRILGDALQIKFPAEFDLVHSAGLIEHFTGGDRLKIIEAHTKPLKPGGYLLLVFPVNNVFYWLQREFLWLVGRWKATDDYLWNPREMHNTLDLHGFSIVKKFSFACEVGVLAKMKSAKSLTI